MLATHSIGFLRRAWELYKEDSNQVVFIDMHDFDFDSDVKLVPASPTRDLWRRILDVSIGDLSSLLAPDQVVLCEGKPVSGNSRRDKKAEFDARCYRQIFAGDYSTTDWISVGNNDDAQRDFVGIGSEAFTLTPGTRVIRLIDRDLRTSIEIAELEKQGVKTLSRRNIEAYLLDDAVLAKFCEKVGKPEALQGILYARDYALACSINSGGDEDDYKKTVGEVYNAARKSLVGQPAGSNFQEFAVAHLAPLVKDAPGVYGELRKSIFGI